MNPFIVALGVGFIVDGVGSIIKYRTQTIPEHAVRALRALGGAAVIIIGISV